MSLGRKIQPPPDIRHRILQRFPQPRIHLVNRFANRRVGVGLLPCRLPLGIQLLFSCWSIFG